MSKRLILSLALITGLLLYLKSTKQPSNKLPTIAIAQMIEHPALDATRQGIIDGLANAGLQQGKSINISYQCAQGNIAIANQIAQHFDSLNPSLIIAIGTSTSQTFLKSAKHTPVLFTSVTDPLAAKLTSNLQKPDFGLTGVSNFISSTLQIQKFKQILPNLQRLGIIYNPSETNSIALLTSMQDASQSLNIKLLTATASSTDEVSMAAASLIQQGADALFVNNDNTALSAFDSVIKESSRAHIPTFVSDTDLVQQGALAAVGPNQYQLGIQTARLALDILNGTKIPSIPVQFPVASEFFINRSVANSLHIPISDSIYNEADKIITSSPSNHSL